MKGAVALPKLGQQKGNARVWPSGARCCRWKRGKRSREA